MRLFAALLALAAGLLCAAAIALAANDGETDTSFGGGDGIVDVGLGDVLGAGLPFVAPMPDGGVVAAVDTDARGRGRGDIALPPDGLLLLRLKADGSPYTDGAWNDAGRVLESDLGGEVEALRVLADGDIVVVLSDGSLLSILNLTSAGDRDGDFGGGDGLAEVLDDGERCDDGSGTVEKAIVAPAGDRIDVVWACGPHGYHDAYTRNGSVVTGFTPHGIFGLDKTEFFMRDATVDTEGRLVVLGWTLDGSSGTFRGTDDRLKLLRYLPNGTRDETLAVDVAGEGHTVATDASDAIVVTQPTGQSSWDFRKFTETGGTFPGWGTDGRSLVANDAFANSYPFPESAAFMVHQADGKLIVVVNGDGEAGAWSLVAFRLTTGGALDTTFGENGLVRFLPDAGGRDFGANGPPVLMSDGRLLFAGSLSSCSGGKGCVSSRAISDSEAGLVIVRLGTAPPPEQTTTTTATTSTTPQPAPPATTVPSRSPRIARTCLSRRSFTIRLRPRSVRSATVRVGNKRLRVRRLNGRLTATVDLRKFKQATFTVRIDARDARGRRVRESRRYRTCRVGENGPKVKGGSIVVTVG